MKIAVLSDIHGNLLALESVLEDIGLIDADRILFLGDYVLAGPEPVFTLNLCMSLFEKDNVEMIQGNTDEMIAYYNDTVFGNVSKSAPIMANALQDDVSIISEKQKIFLKNLPKQKELTIDGVNILMVHGSPRKNNEDILPTTPLEKVEEMLEGVSSDIVLCGHTHIPCGFQTNSKKTVVNVGSVGRPFTENPESCYAIITTLGDGNFEVEHRFVKYDNYEASRVLAQRKFQGADKLAQMLINPTQRHF